MQLRARNAKYLQAALFKGAPKCGEMQTLAASLYAHLYAQQPGATHESAGCQAHHFDSDKDGIGCETSARLPFLTALVAPCDNRSFISRGQEEGAR